MSSKQGGAGRLMLGAIRSIKPSQGGLPTELPETTETKTTDELSSSTTLKPLKKMALGPLRTSREGSSSTPKNPPASKRELVNNELSTRRVVKSRAPAGPHREGVRGGAGRAYPPQQNSSADNGTSEWVRVAQAAGFSSPAEMLMVQQQQLMTLMMSMQAGGAHAPYPNQQPSPQP